MNNINLIENDNCTIEYNDCILFDDLNAPCFSKEWKKLFKRHSNSNILPYAIYYFDNGYYGIIFEYQGCFHALLMGGGDEYLYQMNNLAFLLYNFDKPNGSMEEVKSNTKICFRIMLFNNDIQQLYDDYDELGPVDTEEFLSDVKKYNDSMMEDNDEPMFAESPDLIEELI